MLKFFSSRADHPLADTREFQRALDDLIAKAPEEGLKEAIGWLETMTIDPEGDLAAQLRVLAALDNAAQAHNRSLAQVFISTGVARSSGRNTTWKLVRRYVRLCSDRYCDLLGALEASRRASAPVIAEAAVRLVRNSCSAQRLDALRYGPYDPHHWTLIGHALLVAQAAGVADLAIRIRPNRPTETTVANEYLRSVALATAALDELDEVQIDQAARLVHYVLPSLRLGPTPENDSLFWIDPTLGMPPARMVKPPQNPGASVRYFSGAHALDTLLEMESLAGHGSVPPVAGVDSSDGALNFASLLQHLIRHWSAEPPVRRHRRHPLPGQLHAIEGIEQFADHLSGEFQARPAIWDQHNASLNGIGASTATSSATQLRIGELVGVHSHDGDHWLAGVVRRIRRNDDHTTQIGVELQSWHPVAARADDGARQTQVLLLDPLQKGGTVRVAMPINTLRAGAALYLIGQNKALKLIPVALVERGADHEIRSYQVNANT